MKSNLSGFLGCYLCFWFLPKQALPNPKSQRSTLLSSSKGFILLVLTFRSMIHFELVCVYGLRKGSSFILLHVVIQLSQSHSLKKLFFPPLNCLDTQNNLCKINPPLYPCAILLSLKASSVIKIKCKILSEFL